MPDCQQGCTIRARHIPDCPDPDTCKGCLPRPADDGHLWCRHCRDRLHVTLTKTPGLVAHIRAHVEPGATVVDTAIHRHKAEPPAPLNVAAVADADDLHAALADLAAIVAVGRHLTGPDWAGTDVRPASKRRTSWGSVVYDPARPVGLTNPETTTTVAAWLAPHEEWVTATEGATGAAEWLLAIYAKLDRRWPLQERPQHLPTPCPACDRLTLTRYAPGAKGLDPVICCTDDDCGEVIRQELYDWHTRRLTGRSAS